MLFRLRYTVNAFVGASEKYEFIPKSGSPVAEFYWCLDPEESVVNIGRIECEVKAGTAERTVTLAFDPNIISPLDPKHQDHQAQNQ